MIKITRFGDEFKALICSGESAGYWEASTSLEAVIKQVKKWPGASEALFQIDI